MNAELQAKWQQTAARQVLGAYKNKKLDRDEIAMEAIIHVENEDYLNPAKSLNEIFRKVQKEFTHKYELLMILAQCTSQKEWLERRSKFLKKGEIYVA